MEQYCSSTVKINRAFLVLSRAVKTSMSTLIFVVRVGLVVWVSWVVLASVLLSSLSLSSCLSSFVGFDFSRFFPCFSWSRSASDSVEIRSDHFVALGHVACVSGGGKSSSSAILIMFSVLFISSDRDTYSSAGGAKVVFNGHRVLFVVSLDQATVIEVQWIDVPLRLEI